MTYIPTIVIDVHLHIAHKHTHTHTHTDMLGNFVHAIDRCIF